MRISIDNPTGGLTQWDVGQRLLVEDIQAGVLVDFKIRNQEPLGMKTYENGGGIYVDIPNILLQNDGYLYVYFYVLDGEKGYTTLTWRCVVASRPKPSDYVYTETEVLTWHTLEERVSYLEQHGGSGGAGGYYTPSIEQVADDSLRFTYTQSQAGMPGVEPVTVTLPAGPQGEPGEPGPAGHTPEKGTDYFTENEIQEIAEQAAQLVDVPGVSLTEYELVFSDIVQEDAREYFRDVDDDGNPFSLTNILIIMFTPPFAESANSAGRQIACRHDSMWAINNFIGISNSIAADNSAVGRYDVLTGEIINGYQVCTRGYRSQNTTNSFGTMILETGAGESGISFYNDSTKLMQINNTVGNFECVKIVGYTNPLVSAGTMINLYRKKGS